MDIAETVVPSILNRRVDIEDLHALRDALDGADVVYHLAGRDIRVDVYAWYSQLTAREILNFGIALGELALLGLFIAQRLPAK